MILNHCTVSCCFRPHDFGQNTLKTTNLVRWLFMRKQILLTWSKREDPILVYLHNSVFCAKGHGKLLIIFPLALTEKNIYYLLNWTFITQSGLCCICLNWWGFGHGIAIACWRKIIWVLEPTKRQLFFGADKCIHTDVKRPRVILTIMHIQPIQQWITDPVLLS